MNDVPHISIKVRDMVELRHTCLCKKKKVVYAATMVEAREQLDVWKKTHDCVKRGGF